MSLSCASLVSAWWFVFADALPLGYDAPGAEASLIERTIRVRNTRALTHPAR